MNLLSGLFGNGQDASDSNTTNIKPAVKHSQTREADPSDTGRKVWPRFHVGSQTDTTNDISYDDYTDRLANFKNQYIEIYHIPTGKNVLFKSFLTVFKDSFRSEYNKESVFGRMDPIATFKRTGRIITLGWDVPSSSIQEAKENQSKANRLIQMLYPVYDEGDGGATTMRSGPIFRIKMGNLIIQPGHENVIGEAKDIGLSGIIEGFNYEPKLDQGVFDLRSGEIYPKGITANIQFTVLHDTPLGWVMDGRDNAKPRLGVTGEEGGEAKASADRFPYGGNNDDDFGTRKTRPLPNVKQDDWASRLDVQADLIRRRAAVRAQRVLTAGQDLFRL